MCGRVHHRSSGEGLDNLQVLAEYDHLKPDDVQACLAYASDMLKSERVYLLPTS